MSLWHLHLVVAANNEDPVRLRTPALPILRLPQGRWSAHLALPTMGVEQSRLAKPARHTRCRAWQPVEVEVRSLHTALQASRLE
jgi:hypothetical protein